MPSNKFSFALFALILSLQACTNSNYKPSGPGKAEISFVDSILKYDKGVNVKVECSRWLDTSDEGMMFITDINKIRTAIIAFDEKTLYCYQKMSKEWILSDSFKIELYPAEMWLTDLNGDGFNDIRICYPVMRGNYVCTVLLYHPESSSFKHNRFFDEMNIGYDSATHLVRVSGLGGLYDNVKKLYRITGDSLMFYKGVEMSISSTDSIGELRYYENVAGEKTLVKTVKENCNKVFKDFDNEYWQDDIHYFFKGVSL